MENIITAKTIDDVCVIAFEFNEINLDQREILKDKLEEFSNRTAGGFVIDLSKVGFVSSLVIAVIVSFTKEVRAKGKEIKLSGLSEEALSVFKLTKMDSIFEMHKTEQDAVESFK